MSMHREIAPSQPFHRPGKYIKLSSPLNRNRSLQPLGDHVRLSEDRVDFDLALLEDLLFPHLGPRPWEMTEHLRGNPLTQTLHWHGAVRTEDDGAGAWVK